jgi:predicted esterase
MRMLLGITLLACVAAAGEARDVDAKEWKRIRKLLPAYLWQPDAKKRAKAVATWEERAYDDVRLTKAQYRELGRLLRDGSPFTREKKRARAFDVETGQPGEKVAVRAIITTKYKPGCGKSFPLILSLHGGPAATEQAARSGMDQQYALWQSYAQTVRGIVACPAIPGDQTGEREWTILKNIVDELDRVFNVDRDRILLTGHSWGGILCWQLGPRHAADLAALAPFVCAVNPGRRHLSNCRNLPVYSVQGKRDIKWILETGRERIAVLKELGYDHVYREMPGGHDSFKTEFGKIAEWFVARPRRLYARHVTRRGGGGADWYWLRTERTSFDARIVDEHTLDVEVGGPCEVFLSDEMVDLDAPVEIRRDGHPVFRGSKVRRLGFTLRHVRETGDRARVFAASVRLE